MLGSTGARHGPIAQRLEQQTHNLLVPGSNPGGPTNILNVLNEFRRGSVVFTSFTGVQLRLSCSLLRSCFPIQAIYPIDVCGRDEMPVSVHRDLDRTVPHLILYVGKGCTVLYQKTSERMPEVMESESSETRML